MIADNKNGSRDSVNATGHAHEPFHLTMQRKALVFLLMLVVLVSGLLSYVFYQSVNEILKDELHRRGDAIAESIAESATLGVLLADKVILIDVATRFLEEEDLEYIWIMNSRGELIYPARSALEPDLARQAMLSDVIAKKAKLSVSGNLGLIMHGRPAFSGYHVAMPVWRQVSRAGLGVGGEEMALNVRGAALKQEVIGFVQVGLSVDRIEAQAGMVMFRAAFLVVGVTFLGALFAAMLLSRWLEPLRSVTALAQRIRLLGFQGAVGRTEDDVMQLIARAPRPSQSDEIGMLQQTFLEMLKEIGVHDRRLREQKARLKQMVADRTGQLARAKEAALAANKAKSTFLASMSHEIRTPLNAVIGYTEMLQCGLAQTPEKQQEYLEIIQSSGRHLLAVINDILDLSKLEEGGYSLQPASFSLLACVEQAIHFVQPKMYEKGLTGTVDCPDIEIVNDERMLKQVLINLLSNACKFTEDGGRVDVTVTVDDVGVQIVVADTGVGMTEKEVEQSLQSFVQILQGEVKKNEGTGLGLPIVDRFVKLMNGKLSIFSEKGEGTMVRVRIPREMTQAVYSLRS